MAFTNARFLSLWTSLKRSQEPQTILWHLLENSLELNLKIKDIMKLRSSYALPGSFTIFNSLTQHSLEWGIIILNYEIGRKVGFGPKDTKEEANNEAWMRLN